MRKDALGEPLSDLSEAFVVNEEQMNRMGGEGGKEGRVEEG